MTTSKFNRSEIFRTAWQFVKEGGTKFALALKQAWFSAKLSLETAAEAIAEAANAVVTNAKELVYQTVEAAGITLEAALTHVFSLCQDAGLNCNIWKKSGLNRIYINGFGRDITAYLEMNNSDMREYNVTTCNGLGAALHVFTNCAQGAKWKANRCENVRTRIAKMIP